MKNYKIRMLISIFVALSVSAICIADLSAQSGRKKINIATVEYPPSFYSDGTGDAADMLTEVLDSMGYDITITILPLGRAIGMVNNGDIDCAFLFPQTDPEATIPIPIYYSATVFVYKKSRFPEGIRFNEISDLKGYKVGGLSNSMWTVKLLQESEGLELDFAPSNEMNMKKIDMERIDLLPLSHMVAQSIIESVFPSRREAFGITAPFGIKPVCLIFSEKYPGNQSLIDDVRRKAEDIDIREILQKHFGKNFQDGIIPNYMVTGNINN